MKPITYYTRIRKQMNYRPPYAALATLAWYCDADDYWERVQRIADWLNGRNPDDSAIVLDEDETYTPYGSEHIRAESVCDDCRNSYFLDEWYSHCNMARDNWPGRTNIDGDIVACPYFVPQSVFKIKEA